LNQESSIYRSHLKPSNVFDEELLNLFSLGAFGGHDDRWNGFDPQDTTGERAPLTLHQEEVAATVRCWADRYWGKNSELLDGALELAMAVSIAFTP